MKRVFMVLLLAVSSSSVLCFYAETDRHVMAESGTGPLYSSREKIVLTRDAATGKVSGTLERGTIAVAYVNLWSRQTIERSNALYTPVATITDVQPVILFSHCDLPYKFAIQQGKLQVSGQCANANWDEPPIEVVVLYSK